MDFPFYAERARGCDQGVTVFKIMGTLLIGNFSKGISGVNDDSFITVNTDMKDELYSTSQMCYLKHTSINNT